MIKRRSTVAGLEKRAGLAILSLLRKIGDLQRLEVAYIFCLYDA